MFVTPKDCAAAIDISESQFSTLRTVLRPAIPEKLRGTGKPGRPCLYLSAPETVAWLAQILPRFTADQRRNLFNRAVLL